MAVKVNWLKLRAKLGDLVAGLREVASGVVVERAAAKVQSQIDASSKRILAQHVYTGNALATSTTTRGGRRVELTTAGYLKFHEWWPFRSGMPPFVVRNAAKIYAAELKAALAGEESPLLLADEEAAEAAERKRAHAERKAHEREEKERERRLDAAARERQRKADLLRRHKARVERIQRRSAARDERRKATAARVAARKGKAEEKRAERSRETFKRVTARIARRQARDAKRAARTT